MPNGASPELRKHQRRLSSLESRRKDHLKKTSAEKQLAQIAKSSMGTVSTRITLQLVQFAVTIILARLLSPKDFGLVAMVMVFRGLLTVFLNTGLTASLVQRRNLLRAHIDTAFTLNGLLGIALFLFCWALSPLVARFFVEPSLLWLIRIAGLGYLVGPLITVPQALLRRAMRFRTINVIDSVGAVVNHVTCLILALNGAGPWALLVGGLAGTTFSAPIYWSFSLEKPQLRFSKQAFVEMFSFSSWIFLANVFNYGSRNIDKAVIGKLLGPFPLGVYNLSYNLMMIPVENIAYPIKDVLFSSFAQAQDDNRELIFTYTSVMIYVSLAVAPVMAGLALIADIFVPVAYGVQWADAIPIVQILAAVGFVQCLMIPGSTMIMARGYSKLMFWFQSFSCLLITFSFFVGIPWGIVGVSLAYAVANIGLFVSSVVILKMLIQIPIKNTLAAMQSSALPSVAMALFIWGVIRPVCDRFNLNAISSLALQMSAGALMYIVCVWLIHPQVCQSIIRFVGNNVLRRSTLEI